MEPDLLDLLQNKLQIYTKHEFSFNTNDLNNQQGFERDMCTCLLPLDKLPAFPIPLSSSLVSTHLGYVPIPALPPNPKDQHGTRLSSALDFEVFQNNAHYFYFLTANPFANLIIINVL